MQCCWYFQRIGNIYVFCRGAICLGPDYIFMLSTGSFIIISSILFIIFTCVLSARVICGFIALVTIAFMWRCSTMDPGICPKSAEPPTNAAPHEPLLESIKYFDNNGAEYEVRLERKWCYACHHHRPLRAIHCRFCDVCIARRDHHCPWVGTCVGERNYRFYWFFLWSALSLVCTIIIGGIESIVIRAREISQDVRNEGKNSLFLAIAETHFIEPILVLLALLVFCLVAPLTAYHTMLVARNMTTVEETRESVNRINYYNKGGCLKNIKESLCMSIPTSKLQTSIVPDLTTSSPLPTSTIEVVVEANEEL